MMTLWRGHRPLLAGLALILAANAAALLGVAYNRSGSPESQVALSQRELVSPLLWWRYKQEESSLWLQLQPRILPPASEGRVEAWATYSSGNPEWLNEEKLRELGVTLPAAEDRMRHFHKEMKKEVLLVLEMNGPLYQRALQRARDNLSREQSLADAHKGDKEFELRLKNAESALKREEAETSRLFIADAGLDAAKLRAKYPERDRYVIVRGRIHPVLQHENQGQRVSWVGYIGGLENDRINVPLELRQAIENTSTASKAQAPFEAVVAFGKRFEPWLVSAAARP